ncbi:MAG: glycoside hydrolase family 31 protein [Clostridia bacterium]|nr:glycoside hydrolase family 31 protein [Clostridia bacterium]
MNYLSFDLGNKTLRISAYSKNVLRIRVSEGFGETLFERYGIYNPADFDGTVSGDSIAAGELSASYGDGVVTVSSGRFTRRIEIGKDVAEVKEYIDGKLGGLRPEYRQIIGDEAKRNYGTVDFHRDPKYIEITTEGETFYGLGESNEDRLILNGRTYLERVVYQRCEIPIPFVMTKAGYGVLCNSTFWHGVDVCERDKNKILWYLPDGDLDFMIFAGDTLGDILERFTYVTRRPMLMPKWAYGLTFTEQYYADQFEVMHTAEKFRDKKLPCDMISLEPGWMSKRYDFSVEKKWNTERFFINDWARKDDPYDANKGFFLSALKRHGFKTQLWLCCQHDFTAHEENLAGNETDFGIPAWFDHLRAFVNDGASSFKVDPCHVCDSADEARVYANGKAEPEMHNLMQTLCVKEMYQGALAHTGRRPMHHFCGGYTGTGAYSAATTGDNGGGKKSMAWMLNLGISGFSNVSCDMDVHDRQRIHYGFFMPWSQLNAWSGFNHPWWETEDLYKVFEYYDKLRYRFMPYIYSTAINTNLTGMPFCRAMPLMFDDAECENPVSQYMFGEDMLIAAFAETVYLPAGTDWIDYWTGRIEKGGRTVRIEYPDDRGGALYIRGGAIIPTEEPKQYVDCRDAESVTLEIYPEGRSSRVFYEDDGVTMGYENGARSSTVISCEVKKGGCTVTVGKREGSFDGICGGRTYTARVFMKDTPKAVTVNGKKTGFVRDGDYVVFGVGKEGSAEITL